MTGRPGAPHRPPAPRCGRRRRQGLGGGRALSDLQHGVGDGGPGGSDRPGREPLDPRNGGRVSPRGQPGQALRPGDRAAHSRCSEIGLRLIDERTCRRRRLPSLALARSSSLSLSPLSPPPSLSPLSLSLTLFSLSLSLPLSLFLRFPLSLTLRVPLSLPPSPTIRPQFRPDRRNLTRSEWRTQALGVSPLLYSRCQAWAALGDGRVDDCGASGPEDPSESVVAIDPSAAAVGSGHAASAYGWWAGRRGLKPPSRAVEKAAICYRGDASRVLDICRARIVVPTLAGLRRCLAAVANPHRSPGVRLVRVRNGFAPDCDARVTAGYRVFL